MHEGNSPHWRNRVPEGLGCLDRGKDFRGIEWLYIAVCDAMDGAGLEICSAGICRLWWLCLSHVLLCQSGISRSLAPFFVSLVFRWEYGVGVLLYRPLQRML